MEIPQERLGKIPPRMPRPHHFGCLETRTHDTFSYISGTYVGIHILGENVDLLRCELVQQLIQVHVLILAQVLPVQLLIGVHVLWQRPAMTSETAA